jgi:preprotein translocase subunit SecA
MDPEILPDYIGKLAQDEMNLLKEKANIEEFYSLERRIMLQSIDELWMRHIDAMSSLREDVAFEGYAQRNPLVVYKEKAYDKFTNLMNELEYKVIKSLFSVKTISEVEMKELDQANFNENEAELEQLLESFSEENKPVKKSNKTNPLFANPGNTPQQKSQPKKVEKKRMRV